MIIVHFKTLLNIGNWELYNQKPIGLVALLLVLNQLPYDIKFSFMPIMAMLLILKYLVLLNVQVYLYSCFTLRSTIYFRF